MAETVGDHVLRRLREWGVEQVFAYPGDGINGIVAAFGKADDSPAFIQARHEEMCALQAVGYAKFSGKVGVCMATSGPGAIHLLNGLYDAKLDHVPVVAIVGQTERSAMGGSYQQEVDLQALLSDVASQMAGPASRLYGQNVTNLIRLMTRNAAFDPDFTDEIVRGCCVTHDGSVLHEPTRALLEGQAP